MNLFENLNISKQLLEALNDLKLENPTPIQQETYSIILSGKDIVGIAQTGTGKTFAYLLPVLNGLNFSKQLTPRILIIVPTRELVLQVVDQVEILAKYMTIRILGVYGGTNINTQKKAIVQGIDVLVATPGRLYDLALTGVLKLKDIKKLIIDEVDIMLDLGFKFQIKNILEILPKKRQNIMFSATMTEDVDRIIDDFFVFPEKISIALSGTPLENIRQFCYPVKNFYTKVNLLSFLLSDKEDFSKVIVFISTKKNADKLFEEIDVNYGAETCIIHSNKAQNYRIRSLRQFDEGEKRILIATDVMARGLDFSKVSHVINFDTPTYPENYIHRIGRTGRAENFGKTILFYSEKEMEYKEKIENLMKIKIEEIDFPFEVKISNELTPEEKPKIADKTKHNRNTKIEIKGAAFHEKKAKNKKTYKGGTYLKKMEKRNKAKRRKG